MGTTRYERAPELEGLNVYVIRPTTDDGLEVVTGEELLDNFFEHGFYQPYIPLQMTPIEPKPIVEPTPGDDILDRRELFSIALAFRLEGGCLILFDDNQRDPSFLLEQTEGFVAIRRVSNVRTATLDLPDHPTYPLRSVTLTPATPGGIVDTLVGEL